MPINLEDARFVHFSFDPDQPVIQGTVIGLYGSNLYIKDMACAIPGGGWAPLPASHEQCVVSNGLPPNDNNVILTGEKGHFYITPKRSLE
jgi:hypothetical protein